MRTKLLTWEKGRKEEAWKEEEEEEEEHAVTVEIKEEKKRI